MIFVVLIVLVLLIGCCGAAAVRRRRRAKSELQTLQADKHAVNSDKPAVKGLIEIPHLPWPHQLWGKTCQPAPCCNRQIWSRAS